MGKSQVRRQVLAVTTAASRSPGASSGTEGEQQESEYNIITNYMYGICRYIFHGRKFSPIIIIFLNSNYLIHLSLLLVER